MKRWFHGYYKPTDEEFSVIWDKAIIVVDTNVLLNLYTYSAATSQEVLTLLSELGERLWIPHQVALEYHKNRYGIILKELKRYDDISKDLEKVSTALRARKQHPYVSSKLAARFEDIEAEIKKELEEGDSKHRSLITTDNICKKITELFDGKVGAPMTEDILGRIYKEGATRYARKIPPGFSDIKKPEPDRYGDLVLWYQLIEHSKTSKQSVIFITDDLKEDWWWFAGNQRIAPRPELRHEFRCKTEYDIYIYTSEAFIEHSRDSGKKLSEFVIEEIESASKERHLDAAEKRCLKELSCPTFGQFLEKQDRPYDPMADYFKQQEMVERLTRDPVADYLKQQDMLKQLPYDPVADYLKQQEMVARLTSDPVADYLKQQKMIDRLTQIRWDK